MLKGGMQLIIGDGLIGSHLYSLLSPLVKDIEMTSRNQVDLRNDDWDLPDYYRVYICAGETSTQWCEENPSYTKLVNVTNTIKLVEKVKPAQVVWVSSERVFNGDIPFRKVTDEVCPTTEYGRQKVETEKALLERGALVIRLSKVLGQSYPLFDSWITELEKGNVIHPFSNMGMSPLPVRFVVEFIAKLSISYRSGLFQLSALDNLTYDEIALHIAQLIGADTGLVQPIMASESHIYTTLDDNGVVKKLGMSPPDVWEVIDSACSR